MPEFILSESEVAAATYPLHDELFGHHPRYVALAEYTVEAVGRGRQNADIVPALQFVLDSTLAVLSLPTVKSRLPKESLHRSVAAQSVASRLTYRAVTTGLFRKYYRENPHLKPLLTAELGLVLDDHEYMASIAKQPIQDAGIVMGGAAWALRKARPNMTPTDVIARSQGLMRIANADRDGITKILPALGANPQVRYCQPKYYDIKGDGEQVSIDFTDAAWQIVRTYLGTGCPVRAMRSHDAAYRTVLQKWWAESSHLLVPPEVTTYGKRGPGGRHPKRK